LLRGGLADFLLKKPWLPLATPPSFGIFHALLSTVLVTGLGLAVAIPLGIGTGLFIAEVAPALVRQILQPALEILAGIPAVVYGFFGYVTLVKNFEQWFDMPTGECILAAGIILGLMVLPFIASTAAESFGSVAQELRDSAFSLGVTRFFLVRRIIFRKALPGLFAAVALGLARALGETLAVLMLAGNSAAVPHSLLDRGQPITALLATELGETALHSDKYHALYTAGLFLMAAVLCINVIIWYLKGRILANTHA
ncbi:MAG: phosphate ABC transporter permease subunit PstC, partial [Nitrospirae bacterium]|nr:phosphate ABC transporter permease subunit PstC [Nitrospirota bacterium]